MTRTIQLFLSFFVAFFPAAAGSQEVPRDLSASVEVTAANEVSNLDRQTGRVVSRIDITLTNRGESPVTGPLHAVVDFVGEGDMGLVAMADALGNRGEPPYQAQYLDLSGLLGGGGLEPGGVLDFELRFSRPSDLKVLYRVGVFGVANRPPKAAFTAPSELLSGEEGTFDASPSTDPDGDELTYEWQFDTGLVADGRSPVVALPRPGVYDVVLRVRDPGGLESTASRTVLVVPEDGFALARTRTLDDCGVPLGGVAIERLDAPGGGLSDAVDGYLVLGGDAGFYAWKFSKPGHLPVWRETVLPDREVRLLASPWMTPVPLAGVAVSPLAPAAVGDAGDGVRILLPAGAFSDPGEARLVSLHGQSLPFPLPAGWSPLAAAHLDGPGTGLLETGTATWHPLEPLRPGDMTAVVRFDETSRRWMVVATPPPGALVQSTWEAYGFQTLVVADSLKPPAPVAGAALEGLEAPPLAAVTAEGSAEPAIRTASLDPNLVKTTARVVFAAETGQASGRLFRADITEDYRFSGGGTFRPAARDATFFAYQRPGGDAQTLEARFPLRPSRLFSPADLDLAVVTADVFDHSAFLLAVLGSEGGTLSAGKLRLTLSPGLLSVGTAVELRQLDPAGFANALHGLSPFLAFQLGYSPREAAELLATFTGLPPESDFVLGRVIGTTDGEGLQPVLRMRTGADGTARSVEPETPPRLPGITSGGTFVLVGVDGPQGLVRGTVSALDGQARAGLLASVDATPWRVLTAAGGGFTLLAPPGAGGASATDPADGNRGMAAFSMADPAAGAVVEIALVATGPSVVSISPADGATKVRPVEPVVVRFSEPLAPGSFGPAALLLTKDGDPTPVPGSLGLGDLDRTATFLPANPLEAAATYTITLNENIRNPGGIPIEGSLLFSFATAAPFVRAEGAQLVIYEPDAENVPEETLARLVGYDPAAALSIVVAAGSAGTADPGVPVILVNENSGETATVLSGTDGSFASFISAAEEDFVSAVFVNANDTRISIPATRQLFDDGRVGLYHQGGILEAESDGGPVRVLVEPDAIETRSKFKVNPVDLVQLIQILQGSEPNEGQLLGGVTVSYELDGELSVAAKISVPLDRDALQLPPGIVAAEDATFLLARLVEVDGGYVYDVIDTMRVDGDQLVTQSPPYPGILFERLSRLARTSSGRLSRIPNMAFSALGLASASETIQHQLLLPIMIFQGNTSDIVGRVWAVRTDDNDTPVGEPQAVPGAVVTFEQPPFAPLGRLRPGQFVTTADRDGRFAFRVDVGLEGLGYQIAATHPRFPLTRAIGAGFIPNLAQPLSTFLLQSGIPDVSRRDVYFTIPSAGDFDTPDTVPPVVRAGHSPDLPAAGSNVSLVVTATDDRAMASLDVRLARAFNTAGEPLDIAETATLSSLDGSDSLTRIERRFELTASRSARVVIEIDATDAEGNLSVRDHLVDFGRAPMIPTGEPDGAPPMRVLMGWPQAGSSGHAPFPEILLRFSKALPEEAFTEGQTDWLAFSTNHRVVSLTPSPDYREIRLRFTGDSSGEVRLTVNSLLRSAGQTFDQNPGDDENGAYELSFTLADPPAGILNITRGGGVRGQGLYYYALDRKDGRASELVAHDLRDPANPAEISRFSLPANASDLAFLPGYSLPRSMGADCGTYDLIVVTGGANGGGATGDAINFPKWLWIVDVSDPAQPVRFSSGLISVDPLSLVVKTAVSPPLAAYLEISADSTAIHLLDLVAFTIGHNATAAERELFPDNYQPGLDLNNNGNFCDPGERPSLPSRSPARYYGEVFSFAPLDPRERIVDFDMDATIGAIVGVTYNISARQGRFRNYLANFDPLDDDIGVLDLPPGFEPKRVKFLPAQPILVEGALRILDLAIVSLYGQATDGALAVIDVSNPESPLILGRIDLPAGTGVPNTIELRPDGWITLALGSDLYILDPRHLLEIDPQAGWLAVRGIVPGYGAGVRSYVNDPSGIQVVNAGNRSRTTFTGPTLSFVTLPAAPEQASAFRSLPEEAKRQLVRGARVVERARTQFKRFAPELDGSGNPVVESAPSPDDHYYVLLRTPGGTPAGGRQLDLLVANVTGAGALPAPGPLQRLPGVLVDGDTRDLLVAPPENGNSPPLPAFPGAIRAHRLSDHPASDLYNVYLAGPITLHGSLGPAQARALKAQLPRHFLRADRHIVAALSPGGEAGSAILDPFRSRIAGGGIRPGANVIVPVEYTRRPLIYVPGVMASTLNDNLFFVLWVPIVRGFVERIPFFSPLQPLISSAPGGGSVFPTDVLRYLVREPPALGSIDIQDGFLKFLRDDLAYREYRWNYEEANVKALLRETEGGSPDWDSLAELPDLFPFPYDWRDDNAETAKRLAKYVEMILAIYPDIEKVDIVAHSMGGLVSRRFMLDHPDKVENFVSIASPFLGATKSILSMKTGDLGEFALNLLIPADTSVRIGRNMAALHQLMPNEGLVENLGYRPLRENGWDLNGNGFAFDRLTYEEYARVMDGPLFRDSRPDFAPALPRPIERNRAFHKPEQFDWRNDVSGARHFHIVAVQQLPSTIGWLEATPTLEATDPTPDLGLSFPPARFPRTNRVRDTRPLDGTGGQVELEPGSFRLGYTLQPRRSAGDGTVPLLSQTRGYGAGDQHDLNAPGAVMAAIVSEGTDKASEKAASHVDVLGNPQLQRLVGQILTEGLEQSELPELTINAEDQVEQGAVFSFGIQIGGPAPPGEEPVIIWETGDGRTLKSGLETVSHVYSHSGVHTLTCAVYYPGSGLGTIASKRITVTNAVPQITLVAEPTNLRPGETVSLRVDRADRAWGDRHTYQWTFDGQPDPDVPASSFVISRNHQLTGTYEVSVRVTDDDGASVEASTSYTVGFGPAVGNSPPVPTNDPDNLPDLREGAAKEYAVVIVSGHDATNDKTEVRLGGRLLTQTRKSILRDDGSLARTTSGSRAESMRIFRTPDNSGAIPQNARVRVKAAGERVTLAIRHVRPDNTVNAFVLARRTSPGDVLHLEFRWDDLTGAADDAVPGWLTPTAHAGRRSSTHAGDPAAVTLRRNRVTGTTEIAATDRTEDDPATQISGSPLGIIETRVDDDPTTDFDESSTLEGASVTLLATTTQATSGLPTGAVGYVAIDTSGQTTIIDQEPLSATVIDTVTEEQAAAVRGAIREVFVEGMDLIRPWLIEENDLWVLEQGSGASLWGGRPLSRSAYIYGKSDNDIELLLPVFKKPFIDASEEYTKSNKFTLDPFNSSHAERFDRVAHFPTYMTGDWYFNPPQGVDANGTLMSGIPDPEDRDEYDEYRFIATHWRYYLPRNVMQTLGGPAQSDENGYFIEIDKATTIGNRKIFQLPATPAEIIAASLTHVAKSDPALKEHLHEVTFFPYRREHFICGVPSVERPPPFGADPIGDAGMGRGLLFLKWALEGIFIPHQAGVGGDATGIPFNANLPQTDAELRQLVHDRLVARADSFALEGFEWGLSQEYSLLSASAHLRVERAGGEELRAAPVIADYVRAHDEAVMRKVGKAVIRAVLARMVADPSARLDVFGTNPAEFLSNDKHYRSFEDYIARIASDHLTTVGLSKEEVRAFLGAKLGDDPTYRQIRLSPGGVTAFVERGFTYLRDVVSNGENSPRSVHVAALEAMPRAGRVPEYVRRNANARAIDHGLPAFTEDDTPGLPAFTRIDLPGRRAWWGRSPGAEARYRFVPELIKRGYGNAPSQTVDVVLENTPGDPLIWPDVTVAAGQTSITLNRRLDTDKDPFFTIARDVSDTFAQTQTHTFFLAGAGMADDSFSLNNTATFESSFLDFEPYFDDERYAEPSSDPEGTRWVYRSIALDDAEKDLFIENDLKEGKHRSPALFGGFVLEAELDEKAKQLDDIVKGGGTFQGWTEADVSLMTREEKGAILHVDGSSPSAAFISTTELPLFAITTRLTDSPGKKRWLLAFEVPLDQGIEYVLRANGAPMRINFDETSEVAYPRKILFRQAYLFEVIDDPPGQLPGSRFLRFEGYYQGAAP